MGEGNIGAWLKDAKLELSSNAWSGVEDFNWLKKVCARGGGGGDSPPNHPKVQPQISSTQDSPFAQEHSPNWSVMLHSDRRVFDLRA